MFNNSNSTDTAGFDLVNWYDYYKIDVVTLTFAPGTLQTLPSYGKVPEGYEGYPYDPTYRDLKLFVEEIDEGLYHVSIRDYSCGWTRDLGDGNYDYDYDAHPGWSGLERILDDLNRRMSTGEIDLDRALMEYYTVGSDSLRLKPSNITKHPSPESEREEIRKKLSRLQNKDFARACMALMRRGALSEEDIADLQDERYCELAFGSSFPILKRTFAKGAEAPKGEAKVDGDQKYYYGIYELGGKRYIVTNDWYGFNPGAKRNNRGPFVEWLLDRIDV